MDLGPSPPLEKFQDHHWLKAGTIKLIVLEWHHEEQIPVAYLGTQPVVGQYRKLDNISGSFNGSTTTFNLTVSAAAVTAGTAQQLLISVGGVIQNPGTDYTVSTNTITFTTAPAAGLDFFGVLMGDTLNIGTPSDSAVTLSKLNTTNSGTNGQVLQTSGSALSWRSATSPSFMIALS